MGKSIQIEDNITDETNHHSTWNLGERGHVVVTSAAFLDCSIESFSFRYMLIMSNAVEINLHLCKFMLAWVELPISKYLYDPEIPFEVELV